ncbi:ROK family protein, partial [Anoxynatronum sibiricum]
MGVPGSVNQKTRKMLMTQSWFNVEEVENIEKLVEASFPCCTTIIKNDINLAATGEMRYGIGRGYKNLIYVSVDMGVGAGIILEGKLYEGSRFASGEIGYSKICCGTSRNLEEETSIRSILQQIKDNKLLNKDDRGIRFLSQDKNALNIEEVRKAIKEEDAELVSIMHDVVEKLGFTLANICVLLDIEQIIIG